MKNIKIIKKIALIMLIMLISLANTVLAHSGRTDSNGGHKDNKNKSGLGSYHYHCGGHPAHLHTNGVCPYASSKGSSSSTSSNTSNSSNSKSTTTKTPVATPATISVTGIQINENIENIDVGKSEKITAT